MLSAPIILLLAVTAYVVGQLLSRRKPGISGMATSSIYRLYQHSIPLTNRRPTMIGLSPASKLWGGDLVLRRSG